jgi:hypothetical protein
MPAQLSTRLLCRPRLFRIYPNWVRKVFQEEWKSCFQADGCQLIFAKHSDREPTWPLEECKCTSMELQDVAIVKLQDLPRIAIVDEKGIILHQRGNIFANLLVSIQKGVQRLYPGTGGLVMAVQTLECQTLRNVCW